MLLAAVLGWLDRQHCDVIAFLREENRTLKSQLCGRRLQLDDAQRRRLAALGHRLGRGALREVATLVTPDTILRWHRELVAQKWTYARQRLGRPGVLAEIRRLVVRMATENPTWGYTRIQGALRNLGHRVARSTIASILKAEGIPPSRERPMTWRTFLRAHWPVLMAADFFTTEVWTVSSSPITMPSGIIKASTTRDSAAQASGSSGTCSPPPTDWWLAELLLSCRVASITSTELSDIRPFQTVSSGRSREHESHAGPSTCSQTYRHA